MSNFDYDYGDYELVRIIGPMSKTNTHLVGLFKCKICGREKEVLIHNMKRGEGTSHRWCIKLVGFVEPRFKRIFNTMKLRCNNPNFHKYKNYGGRGIQCKYEYLIDFYDDMYRLYLEHCRLYGEDNTSIDRIDVNGHYEKGNIKWSTNKEQSVNKTNTNPLYVIDNNTGKYLYFNNVSDAANYFNYSNNTLYGFLNGHNTNKNYTFIYDKIDKSLPKLFKRTELQPLFKTVSKNEE